MNSIDPEELIILLVACIIMWCFIIGVYLHHKFHAKSKDIDPPEDMKDE